MGASRSLPVGSASWIAGPRCQASAPGSIGGAAMSERFARFSVLSMPSRLSRAATIAASAWPSAVKPIMSCGTPTGSVFFRSVCHVCHVLP